MTLPSWKYNSIDNSFFNTEFLPNYTNTNTPTTFIGVTPEYNSVLFGNTTTTPTTPINNNWWNNFNDWVNGNLKNGWVDLGQLGLGALNTGFNIYGGLKQLDLARDQLNFTKDAFNTNLANTIKSFNNALEDRARSRYAYMTGNASNADDYINKHKL